jgi:hypothetical protein
MGIQGLVPFLRKRAPGAIEYWSKPDAWETCAVDATLYLCRLFYGNDRIETAEQLAAAYCEFDQALKELNLEPVHVFDGPASPLKRHAHMKRARDAEANRESLDALRKRRQEMACLALDSILVGAESSRVKIEGSTLSDI